MRLYLFIARVNMHTCEGWGQWGCVNTADSDEYRRGRIKQKHTKKIIEIGKNRHADYIRF